MDAMQMNVARLFWTSGIFDGEHSKIGRTSHFKRARGAKSNLLSSNAVFF